MQRNGHCLQVLMQRNGHCSHFKAFGVNGLIGVALGAPPSYYLVKSASMGQKPEGSNVVAYGHQGRTSRALDGTMQHGKEQTARLNTRCL